MRGLRVRLRLPLDVRRRLDLERGREAADGRDDRADEADERLAEIVHSRLGSRARPALRRAKAAQMVGSGETQGDEDIGRWDACRGRHREI